MALPCVIHVCMKNAVWEEPKTLRLLNLKQGDVNKSTFPSPGGQGGPGVGTGKVRECLAGARGCGMRCRSGTCVGTGHGGNRLAARWWWWGQWGPGRAPEGVEGWGGIQGGCRSFSAAVHSSCLRANLFIYLGEGVMPHW